MRTLLRLSGTIGGLTFIMKVRSLIFDDYPLRAELCNVRAGSGIRYLVVLLFPIRNPENRRRSSDLAILARIIGVAAGIFFLILGATAVATALWDAFGAR